MSAGRQDSLDLVMERKVRLVLFFNQFLEIVLMCKFDIWILLSQGLANIDSGKSRPGPTGLFFIQMELSIDKVVKNWLFWKSLFGK